MRRVDLLIRWDLESLLFFYQRSAEQHERPGVEVPHDPENWIQEDGSLGAGGLRAAALDWVRASLVIGLNSIVDGALLALANQLAPSGAPLAELLRRSRRELVRVLEQGHDVELRHLPGWRHVDQLREDANALKHRAGMLLPAEGPSGIPVLRHVDLDPTLLCARATAVWTWLDDLSKACGYPGLGTVPTYLVHGP